jgi:outer membrane protein OmpA-like peptidoglycan-associated protein
MAKDWASDVKIYAPDADDGVIAGIVRYCGIALQKVDSSLVAFSDPVELARVRNNFLKKKCGLTDSDAVLDAAIAEVGERMKADRTKNRVTVYYLLSDKFGKHDLFVKAAKAGAGVAAGAAGAAALAAVGTGAAKAKAPAKAKAAPSKPLVSVASVAAVPVVAATATSVPQGLVSVATQDPMPTVGGMVVDETAATVPLGLVSVASAEPPMPAASTRMSTPVVAAAALGGAGAAGVAASALGNWKGDTSPLGRRFGLLGSSAGKELGLLMWAALALLALALIWLLFFHKPTEHAVAEPATAPVEATAPAAAPVAIPEGAGIIAEVRDEKPVVKVYFATGKADVAPEFAAEAAKVKAYLDAHAGSSLGVSGYNDPTGNAAANAALSKKRAQAVQAALVAATVPATAIELIKPEATTDTKTTNAEARRVEVYVK